MIEPTQLGLEIGSAGGIGAVTGFLAKKIAKVIALIIGAQLMLFKFLESRGILIVNWDKLSGSMTDAGDVMQEQQTWVETTISTIGVGGGFAGGFLLGFRQG